MVDDGDVHCGGHRLRPGMMMRASGKLAARAARNFAPALTGTPAEMELAMQGSWRAGVHAMVPMWHPATR